jgi:hypothetical protein
VRSFGVGLERYFPLPLGDSAGFNISQRQLMPSSSASREELLERVKANIKK